MHPERRREFRFPSLQVEDIEYPSGVLERVKYASPSWGQPFPFSSRYLRLTMRPSLPLLVRMLPLPYLSTAAFYCGSTRSITDRDPIAH